MPNNIEIKARCADLKAVRILLKKHKPRFVGTDFQKDTYFKVPKGRLKLREGNIENNLIHYQRPNLDGPKHSKVHLYKSSPDGDLKNLLLKALEVLVIVKKQREIYFIENVKFHLDQVEGLGGFVEIEAIDKDGNYHLDHLQKQCYHYLEMLCIKQSDLLSESYSDILSKNNF